ASIATEGIDFKIDDVVEAGPIEMLGHPATCQGHTHAVRDSLPEGPGRGFNSGGPTIFRMTRASTIPLTEMLDGVQRHRRLAERFVIFADGFHSGEMQE